MAKKLAGSMTLWNQGELRYQTFLTGDTLPDWAMEQVTNPAAFQEDEQLEVGTEGLPVPGPSMGLQGFHEESAFRPFADKVAHGDREFAVQGLRLPSAPGMPLAQPNLHKEVAAASEGDAEFVTAGQEALHMARLESDEENPAPAQNRSEPVEAERPRRAARPANRGAVQTGDGKPVADAPQAPAPADVKPGDTDTTAAPPAPPA